MLSGGNLIMYIANTWTPSPWYNVKFSLPNGLLTYLSFFLIYYTFSFFVFVFFGTDLFDFNKNWKKKENGFLWEGWCTNVCRNSLYCIEGKNWHSLPCLLFPWALPAIDMWPPKDLFKRENGSLCWKKFPALGTYNRPTELAEWTQEQVLTAAQLLLLQLEELLEETPIVGKFVGNRAFPISTVVTVGLKGEEVRGHSAAVEHSFPHQQKIIIQ